MDVNRVASKNLVISCRRYLIRDCVANVLPLGDLYSPLFEVSDVYRAIANRRVIGVCSVYHAYQTPSIVISNADPETKRALIARAVGAVSGDFITLSNLDDVELFCEYGTILESRVEQQMTANEPRWVTSSGFKVAKIGREELEPLNSFYIHHCAEAWAPIQFQTGPYYCVKQGGKIVSAAGVHIVTPKIAQLGNILTDEHWRGRGFGTACTSALATDLASKGRIVSLFVRKNNDSAISVYEKLGFHKARDVVFLRMRRK